MKEETIIKGLWVKITDNPPPIKKVIKTKITDIWGKERNEQQLIYDRNLWWLPDMSMYVYYTPTHWYCFLKSINKENNK